MMFAERYLSEEVSNALETFGSWHAIVNEALPDTPADNHRAEGTGENEWYTPPPSPQELARLALRLEPDGSWTRFGQDGKQSIAFKDSQTET